MRIDVTPGDVQVASVEVRRHTGGIYTIQISTPRNRNTGIRFSAESRPANPRIIVVSLSSWEDHYNPTVIRFTPESNDEEEALHMGLFDVLDDWSRYSVTLIAIPASVLEEAEEAGSWEPQGPVDYLAT
jgi:hypothetical protein